MIARLFKTRRLRKLREARVSAETALRDAVWRNDTQGQHRAERRLREATHALMRAELR